MAAAVDNARTCTIVAHVVILTEHAAALGHFQDMHCLWWLFAGYLSD